MGVLTESASSQCVLCAAWCWALACIPRHIQAILMPFVLSYPLTRVPPLLTCTSCNMQMGKVHFGVLLGWSVVQSIVLWFMVNQIASNEAAEHRALDLYSCCCIVGYGMVPLLVLSVAVLFTPR